MKTVIIKAFVDDGHTVQINIKGFNCPIIISEGQKVSVSIINKELLVYFEQTNEKQLKKGENAKGGKI